MVEQKEVEAGLAIVVAALSESLESVLWKFSPGMEPHEYSMYWLMHMYFFDWGDKTLHECMLHLKTLGVDERNEILSGQMTPVNIFWVLAPFYDL